MPFKFWAVNVTSLVVAFNSSDKDKISSEAADICSDTEADSSILCTIS